MPVKQSKTSRMAEELIPYATAALGAAASFELGPQAMLLGTFEGYEAGEVLARGARKAHDIYHRGDKDISTPSRAANPAIPYDYGHTFNNMPIPYLDQQRTPYYVYGGRGPGYPQYHHLPVHYSKRGKSHRTYHRKR